MPTTADWQFEATARQLAAIARMQTPGPVAELKSSEAWDTIEGFLGKNAAGVRTTFIGKVGLALSGGGFRAALFHIGVLAKLAELDILRHVEVLSCVSGGSIIGAHYYLEVRKLLQDKADAEITRDDYLRLVERLENDFLAGVQRNIRTRVAAEFLTNLQMLFWPRYSRTLRVGELFESEIFARTRAGGPVPDFWLDKLMIVPRGEPENFAPKIQNWRRRAKVPILLLNATSLNTGHVWQFTSSYMGESPGVIDTEVDGAGRLRRMYYGDAPRGHQGIRLGHAVAASACVPGLFDPLPLAKLYPAMTVRLVDGGVHDNQGVAGLLDQDCSVLLISDASGQMRVESDPAAGVAGVPLRANSILQARVREAQYHEVESRRGAGLLRDVVFVHMKRDLGDAPVDWLGCKEPRDTWNDAQPSGHSNLLTRYGIRKDVQTRLAQIRTDLDSFSDLEAQALMVSGYRMMEHELNGRLQIAPRPQDPAPAWRFLGVEKQMADAGEALMSALAVGQHLGFKIFRQSRALAAATGLLALTAAGLLLWICIRSWTAPLATLKVGDLVLAVFALLLVLAGGRIAIAGSRLRDTLSRLVFGALMVGPGWVLARLHLWIFDPLYLRHNRAKAKQHAG